MCSIARPFFCKGGTSIFDDSLIRSFSWLYSATGTAEIRAT